MLYMEYKKKRKGNFFERFSGELFFSLMHIISDVNFQKNCTTARLMSKDYKNSLCLSRAKYCSFGIMGNYRI